MVSKKADFGTPKGIVKHADFRGALETADFKSLQRDPRTRVRNQTEFEAMRAHLVARHADVEVAHSYTDGAGHIFDCIPIEQQPSLKGSRGKVAEPPELAQILGARTAAPARAVLAAAPGTDRYGNVMQCPPGHIPVRRITLEEMTRFPTLRDFFRKTSAKALAPTAPSADVSQNHRYAYAIQVADNLGAHNFLNVWAPAVGTHQIFSLAQHWYGAGSGNAHQTLEVGWQVYPDKYGHGQPALFIYWTADNYQTTGAYNLDGPGFVQTNPAWPLGGTIAPVSTDGGTQYELQIAVYLYQNNWWLYLGGTGAGNTVGYFPTSIYNGGAMASHATQFLCGGETVCDGSGTWPAMGSGALAAAGWQHAAYQRDIFIFPTSGGAQYATLSGQQPSPGCYTEALGNTSAPWNVYFFFGGPGGGNC